MSMSAASTRSGGGAVRLRVAPAPVMLVMDVLRLFIKKAGAYPYFLVWTGYVLMMLQTLGFAFSPLHTAAYNFRVLRELSFAVYAPSVPLYLRSYGPMPYVVCTVVLYVCLALELMACALLAVVAARPILLERKLLLHVLRGILESVVGWLYIPLLNLYLGTMLCRDRASTLADNDVTDFVADSGSSSGSGSGAGGGAARMLVYNYPTQQCHTGVHTANTVFASVGVVVTCALALLMTFVYDDNIDCGHLLARAHNGLDLFVVVAKTALCLVLHFTYVYKALVVLACVTVVVCVVWLGVVVLTLPYYSLTAASLQCACLCLTALCALVDIFAYTQPLFGFTSLYTVPAGIVAAGCAPLAWLLGYQLASLRVHRLYTCRLRMLAWYGMTAEHVAELPYPRTLAVREQRVMASGLRALEKDLVQEMTAAADSRSGSLLYAMSASLGGGGGGGDEEDEGNDNKDVDSFTRYYHAAQRLHALQRRRSSGGNAHDDDDGTNNHNGKQQQQQRDDAAAATAAHQQQRRDSYYDRLRLDRRRRRGELRHYATEFLVPYVQRVYTCTDVEVATRFVHGVRAHTSDALKLSPEQLVFALRIFVYGLVYFHQSPYVLVCLAAFLQQHCHRPGVALEVLREARRRHDARVTTNAVVLFKSYRLEKAIYEDMGVRDRTHLFALRHARSHHREALLTTMRLWTALHEREDVVSLVHVQDQLAALRESALKSYKLALSTSHDDRTALFSFSAFVEDLFADEELAQNIRQTIDEIELQKKNRMLRGAKAKSQHKIPTIQFSDIVAALQANNDGLHDAGSGGGSGDSSGGGGGAGTGGGAASASSADARGQQALTVLLYSLLLGCLALCCFVLAWAVQRARTAASALTRVHHLNAALEAGYRFTYYTQNLLIYDKEHNCSSSDIHGGDGGSGDDANKAWLDAEAKDGEAATTTTAGGDGDAGTSAASRLRASTERQLLQIALDDSDDRLRCKDDTTRMQLLRNMTVALRRFTRMNARITSGATAAPAGSLTAEYISSNFRPMSFLRVDPYYNATAFLANSSTANMYRKLVDARDALAVAQVQKLAAMSAVAMMSEVTTRASAVVDATQPVRFIVDGPFDTFLTNMYAMNSYTRRDLEDNTRQLVVGVVAAAVVFVLLLLLIAFVFHIKVKWVSRNRAALMSLFTCIPNFFLAQLRERNAERLSAFDAQTNARDEAAGDEAGGGVFGHGSDGVNGDGDDHEGGGGGPRRRGGNRSDSSSDDDDDDEDEDADNVMMEREQYDDNNNDGGGGRGGGDADDMRETAYSASSGNRRHRRRHRGRHDDNDSDDNNDDNNEEDNNNEDGDGGSGLIDMSLLTSNGGHAAMASSALLHAPRRRGRDRKRRSQAFVRALLDMQPLPSCLKKPPALASMMASITTATSMHRNVNNNNNTAAVPPSTMASAAPLAAAPSSSTNNTATQFASTTAYPLVTVLDGSTTGGHVHGNLGGDKDTGYGNSFVSSTHLPLLSSATMATTTTTRKTVRFCLRARDLVDDRPRARLHEPKVTLALSGANLVAEFEKSLVELDQAMERESEAAQHRSDRNSNVDTLLQNNYNAQWLRIHKRLSSLTARVSTFRKLLTAALLLLLVVGVVNLVLMVVFVQYKLAIVQADKQGMLDKAELTDYITAYRHFDTNVANYIKGGDDDVLDEIVRYFFVDQNHLDLINTVGSYSVPLSRSFVNDIADITARTLRLVLTDIIYTVLGTRAVYAMQGKSLTRVPYLATMSYAKDESTASALLRFYPNLLSSPDDYVIPPLAELPDDAAALYSVVSTLQRRKRYHDDEAAVNDVYRAAIARRDAEVVSSTTRQRSTSNTLEYVTTALTAVSVLGAGGLAYVTRRRRLHVCMTLLLLLAMLASVTTLVVEVVLTRQSGALQNVYATSLPHLQQALDYRRFVSRRATLIEQYINTADDATLQEIWQYTPAKLQSMLDGLRSTHTLSTAQLDEIDALDTQYWTWQQISLFLSYAAYAKQRCPHGTVRDWTPPSPPFIVSYNADGKIVPPPSLSSSSLSSGTSGSATMAANNLRTCIAKEEEAKKKKKQQQEQQQNGGGGGDNNNKSSEEEDNDVVHVTFGTDEVPFSTPDVDLQQPSSTLRQMAYYASFGSRSNPIFRSLIDENNNMPPTMMTYYTQRIAHRGTVEQRLYACIATLALSCAAVVGASLVPFVRFVLRIVEGGYGRLVSAVASSSYGFATRVMLSYVGLAVVLFAVDVTLIAVATSATSDATGITVNATTRSQAVRRATALLAYANYTISKDSYLIALTATRQLRDVLPQLRDTRSFLYFRSGATTGGYSHVASMTDEQKELLFERPHTRATDSGGGVDAVLHANDLAKTMMTKKKQQKKQQRSNGHVTAMTAVDEYFAAMTGANADNAALVPTNTTMDELYQTFVSAVETMSKFELRLVPAPTPTTTTTTTTRPPAEDDADGTVDGAVAHVMAAADAAAAVPPTKATFIMAPEQRASIVQLVNTADAYAGVLLDALDRSNSLYQQQCATAVYRGVYPAAAFFVLLALLILLMYIVCMPRLSRRVKHEESDSRLLLKTIPKRIYDAVPAIAMYLDSGVIDATALRESKLPPPPLHDTVVEFIDLWRGVDPAGGVAATAEAFALLNTLPYGALVSDEKGTIIYGNDALHVLLHRDEDDADGLRGKGIEVLMHPGMAASHGQFMAHYMQRRDSLAGRLSHPRSVDVYTREGEAVPVVLVLAEALARYSRVYFVCEVRPGKANRTRHAHSTTTM